MRTDSGSMFVLHLPSHVSDLPAFRMMTDGPFYVFTGTLAFAEVVQLLLLYANGELCPAIFIKPPTLQLPS